MNWVDLVWLGAVLGGLLSGLRGGTLSELLRIASWGLITWGLRMFASPMQPLALTGVAIGLLAVAWAIRRLVCAVAGPPKLLSRLLGMFLGMGRMVALLIFLTLGVARLQSHFWNPPVCENSRCGATVLQLFDHKLPATNQIQRTI